ncbi:hypothetical protein IV55_GL000387 [Furfurilactobacillus siliginis]|uniref:Uncharacterized protein n=1 Tax=Furfurilactobacillus siliginis TaxID=348151 RepID=A0A0R2L0N7_9LACO|nr:hypothetical protein IV55_GL000387 [Furfurilactobacillus siliginis]GEK28362.1 hypothetical protein LSI01_06730 [Furfurilactobacillus siliginis]
MFAGKNDSFATAGFDDDCAAGFVEVFMCEVRLAELVILWCELDVELAVALFPQAASKNMVATV